MLPLGLWGCGPEDCDVLATAAELAAPDATACGSVALGDSTVAAWECAIGAFEAGEPFWLAWHEAGVDSVQHSAMVSRHGRLLALSQDQYQDPPWRIDGRDCLEPYVGADEAGVERILCTGWAPEATHYEVCGECPGCGRPPEPFVWP